MNLLLNPWKTPAAAFFLVLGLAWITAEATAQAVYSPRGPSFAPLPQTAEGQPIDSLQSPEALRIYVDHVAQTGMSVQKAVGNYDYITGRLISSTSPRLLLAPMPPATFQTVAKFGVTNLLAAHKTGASVRYADGLTDELIDQLKQYEDSIFLGALGVAATPNDLPALIDVAKGEDINKNKAGVLMVIIHRMDWANDSGVGDLVSDKLDSIKNFSPQADELRIFAVVSPNPTVQSKMAEFVQELLSKPVGDKYSQISDAKVDLWMVSALDVENKPIMALFPTWLSTRADSWQRSAEKAARPHSDRVDARQNVISRLVGTFSRHLERFAEAPVRDGVRDLIAPLAGDPAYGADYDFLAAGLGDKAAFQELAKAGDPAHSKADDLILNGHAVSSSGEDRYIAQNFLGSVIYQGAGDKVTGILSHLDLATYDKGQWTVTDPQFVQGQVAAAPPAVAAPPQPEASASPTLASPDQPTSTNQMVAPAMATNEAPVAPPAPVTPAPMTAVVTVETKIVTITSNGGHAAVPLSVGAKLIILSDNNDGTVSAQTDFGFKGTVSKSAIQMNDAKVP